MIVAPSSASRVRLRGWMVTLGMQVASQSILAWPQLRTGGRPEGRPYRAGRPLACRPHSPFAYTGFRPAPDGQAAPPHRRRRRPMRDLPIGASDEMTITTTPEMGVAHLPVPMYSTPAMVAHFEGLCLKLLQK